MSVSTNNRIPFVPENTIDPAAGLNEAINTIDSLLQLAVLTVSTNAPIGMPAEGDRHIVGPAPSGVWAGQAGKVARYLDGYWVFYEANWALCKADSVVYARTGSTWAGIQGGSTLEVKDEGVTQGKPAALNFVGAGVHTAPDGAGGINVTIPGGGGSGGGMDNPMTAAHQMIVGGADGAPTALAAPATAGFVLTYLADAIQWAALPAGGMVSSVAGRTGDVLLDKSDVNLDRVDNTPDTEKPVSGPQATALILKVDKVTGYGLSQESFTTGEKAKLAGLDGNHYRGTFVSFAAMTSGVASPVAGDYADVDAGAASDVIRYIWDVTDTKWVGGGAAPALTAAQIKNLYESNPDTNGFTDALKLRLSGIAPGAQVNEATNISVGTRTATTMPVLSSTGLAATLPGATQSLAGLLIAADKTKLDGVAAGSTKNAIDAELRDRSTHTGKQGIDTIDQLQTALDDKQAALNSGANLKTVNGESLLGSGDIVIPGGGSGGTDLTAAQVKSLYESNANTNVYQDAEKAKLSGIAAGAQVNIATNLALGTRTATTQAITNSNGATFTLPAATAALAGLFEATDKTKLAGVATGATANSADATLLARANHTGTQAQSTVTSLTGDLAAKAAKGSNSDITHLTGLLAVPAVVQAGLDAKVDKATGYGLSQENFTAAEKAKLAGLQGSHYRGTFASLAALSSGVSAPVAGDYADVDAGTSSDAIRYIWDATDAKWVGGGAAATLTAAQIKTLYESNPDTNAFTGTEKSKLGGVAAGAQVNVATNLGLGTRTAVAVPLTSSTGAGADLPVATSTLAGVMSAADKSKLDGVTAGATANAANAELRDRSTHTGQQLASTISDFAATVRSVVLAGLSLTTGTAITATDTVLTALGKLQKQITDAVTTLGEKAAKGANSDITQLNSLTAIPTVVQTALDAKLAKTDAAFTKGFASAKQLITAGGTLTLAHGLGGKPKLVIGAYVCETADVGYAVGDEFNDALTYAYTDASVQVTNTVSCDATSLVIWYAVAIRIRNKTTGAFTNITPASWRYVAKAYL